MSEDLWLTAGKVRMIPRGQYASNHVYRMLDVVYYEYGAYIAKQNGVITPPYNDDPEQLNEGWVELVKLPFEKSDYEELVNQYLNELTFIYKGEHDFTIPYQQSNIVTALNSTESNYDLYIAIKEVPVNISISNTNYWVKFFDSELLHDTIVEEVAQLTENVEELTTIIGTDSSQGSIKGNIKEIKDIIGSDGTAAGTIKSGINGNIKDIQDEIGSENINDTIKGNIKILQDEIGDYGIDEGTTKSGIKGEIKDIQDMIYKRTPTNIILYTDNTSSPEKIYYNLLDKNAFIYEKDLGPFTLEHAEAIDNGSFEGLYLGSYWTFPPQSENELPQKWRIWGFDWYLGKMSCCDHHVVVIPDVPVDMLTYTDWSRGVGINKTNTTALGYVNSYMHTHYLDKNGQPEQGDNNDFFCYNRIASKFSIENNNYILRHYEYLSNAGNNSKVSNDGTLYKGGATSYTSTLCEILLPNENMLYGSSIFGNGAGNNIIAYNILPLALLRPGYVISSDVPLEKRYHGSNYERRYRYWLRDIVDATQFACTDGTGHAFISGAQGLLNNENAQYHIRPYFLVCGKPQGSQIYVDQQQ